MIRKSVFEKLGGFDSGYDWAYYDFDLCIKTRKSGYEIVWTPYSELYYHESKYVNNEDPIRSLGNDMRYFFNQWVDEYGRGDPYFNPNFSMDDVDYQIVTKAIKSTIRITKGFYR